MRKEPAQVTERLVEACAVVVVGAADLNTLLGVVSELAGVAGGGDDLACGNAAAQQLVEGVAAELAGCCGDGDHGMPPLVLPIPEPVSTVPVGVQPILKHIT